MKNKHYIYDIKTDEKLGFIEISPYSSFNLFKDDSDCLGAEIHADDHSKLANIIKREQERIWSGIHEGANTMFIFATIKDENQKRIIQLNRFGRYGDNYMTTISTVFNNMDLYDYMKWGY